MSYQTVYDCVIYGESVKAAGAAFSLLEAGKKVLVVSPSGYLGSEISVSFLPFLTKGISRSADILADDLEKCNAWHDGRTDSVAFAIRLLKQLSGMGADILFYERAAGVITDNGLMQGLVLAGKDGITAVRGKTFIDASETLEVCRFSGEKYSMVPDSDSVYYMKFQLLDGASSYPSVISNDVRMTDSCWEPEKLIFVRNGSLSSVRSVISGLKTQYPELRDSVMTASAFHGCRLSSAYLKKDLPLRNLFAADKAESFYFEAHSVLVSARMACGESLAEF